MEQDTTPASAPEALPEGPASIPSSPPPCFILIQALAANVAPQIHWGGWTDGDVMLVLELVRDEVKARVKLSLTSPAPAPLI